MMENNENIFESSEFGDKFKTADGHTAVLICKRLCYNILWDIKCIIMSTDKYGFDGDELEYYPNGKCRLPKSEEMDIIEKIK